jgi:hypothetical protein
MSAQGPSEDELRAAYEAQLKQLRVDDVLVQTVVSLLNLGGRRAGLAPGTEDERDLDQVRQAVEGVRALLPLVEPLLGREAAQLREALAQLQLAYAQGMGASTAPAEPPVPERPGEGGARRGQGPDRPGEGGDPRGGGEGPAQRSGRLWVPGQ